MKRLDRKTLIGVAVIMVLIASWSIGNMLFIAQESGPEADAARVEEGVDPDDTFFSITFQNWIVIFFLSFIGIFYLMAYLYGDAELLEIYGKIMSIVIFMAVGGYLAAEAALTYDGYGIILASTIAFIGVFYLLYSKSFSLKWRVIGAVLTAAG
ncbi:MAG: hypothetical protein ACOC55_05200, partial [Candidatus Natronoplasma sp.]